MSAPTFDAPLTSCEGCRHHDECAKWETVGGIQCPVCGRWYCPHEHVIKSDTHGEMCEECVDEEYQRLIDDSIATMWWELAPLEYYRRPEDRQRV